MKLQIDSDNKNQEIELKLQIDPAHIDQLFRHPLLQQNTTGAPRREQLTSTYYDTPELVLNRHGAFLRLRQSENGWVQTLKSGGTVNAGLYRRNEWEGPVDGPSFDIAALRNLMGPGTHRGKLLRDASSLRPLFTTDVTRTIWNLHLPAGDKIECTLDQGSIEYENWKELICEIELELKSGEPAHLYNCALQLVDSIPMRIGNLSKANRGYALCLPKQHAAVVKAGKLKLNRRMTVEEGFQAIAADCMRQIQGKEPALIQSGDPENVHQMHVGLRRLQSMIDLFKDSVLFPVELQDDLDWLSSTLGAARDWEVLCDSTLPMVEAASPVDVDVPLLQRATADIVHEKQVDVSTAVQSPRYARLMLAVFVWITSATSQSGIAKMQCGKLDAPLSRFAEKSLRHNQHRLLRYGRKLDDADPATRHKMRIAAKKARYASEFFQSLYSPKRVDDYVDALSALQDELGWLNDATVSDRLLHELSEDRHELALGIGFTCGYLISNVTHRDRRLHKFWKCFKSMKLPNRK